MSAATESNSLEHHDHAGAKIGMWFFLLTELILFGGLFLLYSVFRSSNAQEFHNAAYELDTTLGIVVEKHQYDAFHGTELEKLLRDRGVERVVVTGVATHLCCETTARSAFVRGFEVTFPVDGTATYDEQHHLATLLNLAHGFATATRVGDLIDAVNG